MHVASPFGPISASDPLPTWPLESQLSFKALPRSYIAPSSTVFDVSYKAGDWIPVSRVRDAYEGGASAFDTEIERLITIAPGTAYDEFNTSDKIWTKFGSTFITAEGLLFFEPTYRAYLRQLILTAVDDGISYLELRVNFLSKSVPPLACDRRSSGR
jgi:adenosine deaminase CECR1